jgi:hypothetical protein
MYKSSTRSGILITSIVMTALVASSISMVFISINPQGMSGYQTGGNPILKYVTASSEGEGGGEGDGSDDDQGTSVGGEVSGGKGIETGQVDETTNEEDTDAEDEEQQQPIPTLTLSPTPNSLRFPSLCQAVPSLCSTTPTPLVLTPGNLIPGIPIGGLPTATPTPTPPPLFGRNVPLQGGGLFGQQPAAIVPPTPVPTPVLTPERPVPMFGSTLQATPTSPPQFGQIAPEGQILPPTGDKGLTGVAPRTVEPLTRTCPVGNVWDPKAMICVPDVPPLDLELCPDGSIPESTGPGGIRLECPPFEAEQPEIQQPDEPEDEGQEEPDEGQNTPAGPLT